MRTGKINTNKVFKNYKEFIKIKQTTKPLCKHFTLSTIGFLENRIKVKNNQLTKSITQNFSKVCLNKLLSYTQPMSTYRSSTQIRSNKITGRPNIYIRLINSIKDPINISKPDLRITKK